MEYKTIKEVAKINPENITKLYNKDYIMYLDTSNITNGSIDEIVKIDIKDIPSRAKRIVRENDIIYSTVRPNLCHYGILRNIIDNLIVSTGFAVIRCDETKVLPEYLYAYLTLPSITEKLHAIAETSTSAYPSIRPSDLENMIIPVPDIKVQKRISKMLSSLDKKIELNNQINDNLYEILKLNFNNWVDNLENYTKTNLSSIANYKNGLAMQKFRPLDEEGLPVIKIKEMNSGLSNDTERCSSDIDKDVIVNDGDVLFAWSGTLCIKIWCNGKAGLNQHIFKVTSKKFPKWFYYFWTLKHLDKFIQIAAGKATTMGHIKRNELDNAEVLLPEDKEILKMDKIMTPLLEKYIENSIENKSLERLRDTLLPKLMNGEIDLDKVEI